jgi:sigma-B regulation protein RsbU (phosphoserine phosphatase)
VALSKEVAKGNFNVKTQAKGFGEVGTLSTSFSTMAVQLVHRENSIRQLMLEQQEKVRMERELSVAKSVQDNLLPKNPLPEDAGLALAAAYVPAAQVAGDWFTYDFDPRTGETVVVIVDVSGHDMAASMFTAIIAGIFYEVRETHPEKFPVEGFAVKAGRRISGFGGGQWHATMQIARFVKGEATIELTNCGHTFPMILSATKTTGRESKLVRLPSSPIGTSSAYQGITKTVPFLPGDTLLMYTDGVTETREPSGKVYGQKRLFKVGAASAARSVKQIVHLIHRDCLKFRGSLPTQDDLCLVALRVRDDSKADEVG